MILKANKNTTIVKKSFNKAIYKYVQHLQKTTIVYYFSIFSLVNHEIMNPV